MVWTKITFLLNELGNEHTHTHWFVEIREAPLAATETHELFSKWMLMSRKKKNLTTVLWWNFYDNLLFKRYLKPIITGIKTFIQCFFSLKKVPTLSKCAYAGLIKLVVGFADTSCTSVDHRLTCDCVLHNLSTWYNWWQYIWTKHNGFTKTGGKYLITYT